MLFFLLITVTGTAAFAQTAEDSIKTVINTMFTAMKKSDSTLLKTCFTETAVLQTFGRSKEGKTIITTETPGDFAKVLASIPAGAADEQIVYKDLKIDGPMAAVWTPYKFYFNSKFSHCGVNSFQLTRLNGEWKIQYILDTRRKTNCE
ncbi:MAG: hypothetical protein JNM14_00170 [Ferruginibacter sp.]|nr:hypothetical protein [Ferruginibacter sp.]